MMKLYVVVREDLAPGLELAQALHAAVELAILRPEDALAWRRESQNVAILGERGGEAGLSATHARVRAMGARPVLFHEPDLGGAFTAFAFLADDASPAARCLSSLPLALRPPRAA
jgi:hypothetical protein